MSALLFSYLVLPQLATAQLGPTKRILIFNEAGPSYPAIDAVNRGIQSALAAAPYKIEIYSEFLDTILFPDPKRQQDFRTFYLQKYRDRKPDVIITVGPSPLRFMVETHKQAFPGVPIIFCMPMGVTPGHVSLDSDFTGVETDMAAGETLETALRLRPGTEHVVVVGGVGAYDRQLQKVVKEQLKGFSDRVDISYMTDFTMGGLLEHLRHLPEQTVVLFTTVAQDAAGVTYKSTETGPLMAPAANAPVFTLFDMYINHGEVGGDLFSWNDQGKAVGRMALRVLNGERARDIPPVKGVVNFTFDTRALKRWGIAESALPPGSIVLNRQPTFWEMYKRYVIAGAAVLLAEMFIIVALLWQRATRRKTKAELVRSNEQLRSAIEKQRQAEGTLRESEERFRLLANTAPVMIWMSGTDKLCTYFNETWSAFTGRSREEELGNGWVQGVFEEDVERCLETYANAFDRREAFEMEYRLRRHDGEYRWIFSLGVPRLHPDNSFAGYIGSCIDVTDRKLAEEALSSVSRRLIEAHEEERRWIARELHDDINQRLAFLAVNLDVLRRELPGSAGEAQRHLIHLKQQISELGIDVQSLSHRLHSSKLEYLGLGAAASAFCREFCEHNVVQIDFHCDAIPKTLPKETALCLFRVLQEALRNASKHSGRQEYHVSLLSGVDEICLTVSDTGRGFDLEEALKKPGVGITSMRERLKLVGGELSIISEPEAGTLVQARVPLALRAVSVAAASA